MRSVLTSSKTDVNDRERIRKAALNGSQPSAWDSLHGGENVAERVGFEPTVALYRRHAISSRAYSATLAPLRDERSAPRAGGEGGIRTHDGNTPILVFETSALNRSATSPRPREIIS